MKNRINPSSRFIYLTLLAALGLSLSGNLSAQTLDGQMLVTLQVAQKRYEVMKTDRLSSNNERFVNYTTTSGIWRTQSDGTWTSGFLPGNFWYLYDLTGQRKWASYAAHWDKGVRSRATATDNDTGFQILDSFGTGIDSAPSLVDISDYTNVILTAAENMTVERYNATIGAYRAWDQNDSTPTIMPFEVNIDMIMNMELVLWAAENGGSSDYVDYAIAHADTTWEDLVREDGSTYHVVRYDGSGNILLKRTHQGWTRDSTWSRGQAWAVYGFTMMYRFTELPRMLERAEACFDYFISATDAQTTDAIPYSDFDAALDNDNPRDTSAAAIVASAALELYQFTDNEEYLNRALLILESLTKPPYVDSNSSYESLVEKASEKWGEGEVGAIFADFYLLESMVRYRNWIPADLGNWKGIPIEHFYFVQADKWLGNINVWYAPWLYNNDFDGWMFFHEDGNTQDGGDWTYFIK